MPILRLRKHQATFSDEDILINPSDFPGLKLRDVVELRPPRGGGQQQQQQQHQGSRNINNDRILLQIRRWPEINQSYPNSVSIKDSVVNTHLKLFGDVLVNIVDKKEVLVDSIEICFSNAYLARSYMWGLRNHLNNRCVYQQQKLDYLNIRSQICEIWAQGEKVTSGYVDDDTKIVFRSASSLVYLFIQMSSEMWDYDINGDLYCEKAINGFLTDLFETWRQNDCSHDITIVLFSRTFYDAESLDEFPEEMRECLQVDYKGRFYEDCYRVAFQNDRFDLHDWNAKLTTLKSLFNQYQKEVINRHQEKYVTKIPRAYNSSAAQGNFLEVLNMSLNVFEKHYFDRSFDRTGQLSVVVSPGVGVFEVDFEMTNLTKQRIIDNGIGSDLVCLGEQPLHTVPLLKFNSKSNQFEDNLATCDVYNMPHWINLSFYSSQNQVYYSNFVPRIKLPTLNTGKLRNDSSRATIVSDSAATPGQNARPSHDSSAGQLTDDSAGLLCNNQSSSNQLAVQSNGRSSVSSTTPSQQATSGRDSGAQMVANHNHNHHHHHHHRAAIPDLVDYDDYDAQVFKSNSIVTYHCQQQSSRGELSILSDMNSNVDCYLSDADDDDFLERGNRNKSANIQRRSSDVKNYQEYSRNIKRQASENRPIGRGGRNQTGHHHHHHHSQVQSTFTRMSLVDSYLTDVKIKPESADDLSVRGYNVQSSRLNRSIARPKALINPFDPSHMTIKLTPNRRRWTHVFPQGPTGTFIQQHHYQPMAAIGHHHHHHHHHQKGGSPLPYLADVAPGQPAIPEHEPLKSFNISHLQPKRANIGGLNNFDNLSLIRMSLARDMSRNQGGGSSASRKVLSPSAQLAASAAAAAASNLSSNNKSTLVSNDTIRFAWCASGEQEWTPAITTGVDWKSLTMPACLPLTTDFFPSKTSLQNDYVISEYNIDSSFIHPRYTLIEVYRELVCQRLQKGFQIILLPGQTSQLKSTTTTTRTDTGHQKSPAPNASPTSNSTTSTGSSRSHHHHQHHHQHHHHHHHRSSTRNSSSNALALKTSLPPPASSNNPDDQLQELERERTEYTMSIGRIFHKLALNGNTITVTHYRPRHPYPTIKIDYCYRFRAPFHETYGQSWVHFKSEKLENYNWNYLDNYICARGESTFALRSSLKFWRFRILILPSKLCLRKRPSAGRPEAANSGCRATSSESPSGLVRHDVYFQEFSDEEREALMESFIKLLEIINKTRRASSCRTAGSPFSASSSKGSASSISAALTAGLAASGQAAQSAAQEAVQQQQPQQQQPQSKRTAPSRLMVQIGATNNLNGACDGSSLVSADSSTSLSSKDKLAARDAALCNQSDAAAAAAASGDETNSCDELHFESINMDIDSALRDAKRAEWIHVQYHNFYDIFQAFELIIKWMVASGAGIAEMVQSWSRKVGNSSVHVVPCPWEPFAMPHSGKADPLRCPLVIKLHLECLPNCDDSPLDDHQVIALQEKILRLFGFMRFHDLISTENIEHQYIHMSGFAFVALPNLITNDGADDDHNDDKRARPFGARGRSPLANSGAASQEQPVLVTNKPLGSANNKPEGQRKRSNGQQQQLSQGPPLAIEAPSKVSKPFGPNFKLIHQETISSPHEEYITRHIGGARQNKTNRLRGENEQIEFIWSWNYMLTKRWRSPATQDESYAVSLMQDFKDFCRNSNGRLADFWHEIRGTL